MRIVGVSKDGWIGFALKLMEQAGHTVAMICSDQSYHIGCVPNVKSLAGSDLVLYETPYLPVRPPGGAAVIGASPMIGALGCLFSVYAPLLKSAGIRTVPYHQYRSALVAANSLYNKQGPEGSDRIDYKRRVIQVEFGRDRVYETEADTAKEAADRLEVLSEGGDTCIREFDGPHYSIMALFDGERFASPAHLQCEDSSPVERSFTTWPIPISDKLFKITLAKWARYLAHTGYLGPVELDFVLSDDGQVLVSDVEFGWQRVLSEAWVHGLGTDLATLLEGLGRGKVVEYTYHDGGASGQAVTLPGADSWDLPWLTPEAERKVRQQILVPSVGYRVEVPADRGAGQDVYWGQVAKDEDGELRTTGPFVGTTVSLEPGTGPAPHINLPGASVGFSISSSYERDRLFEAKLISKR